MSKRLLYILPAGRDNRKNVANEQRQGLPNITVADREEMMLQGFPGAVNYH